MQQLWRICPVLIFLLLGVQGQSQTVWQDDFSDSTFTANPQWVGDTGVFIVNAQQQLQLDAPPFTSSARLGTPSTAGILATWQFYIRMDFNPSSNNYAKVFLMSTSVNFNQALNGYYLRIGGSSADRISLFRQDGSSSTLIAESVDDIVDRSDVLLNIRVMRDSAFVWTVAIDTALNQNYVTLATGMDSTYLNSAFFGVECVYTSTRADKFYFDNFSVSGQEFVDTIPPVITGNSFPDVDQILLQFSEALDSNTARNRFNYAILGNSVNPLAATWSANSPTAIRLDFADPFANEQQLALRIDGVEDNYGNEMQDTTLNLTFFRPGYRAIVFNEIMADPEPQVALPPAEYIEIYNAVGKSIELKDWLLVLDEDTFSIPEFSLPPDGYALFISSVHKPLFDTLPHIALPLGSTWLRNSGEPLILLDENKRVIDALNFADSWHSNSAKVDGGWSLVQIEPKLVCSDAQNWCSSNAVSGGTPGKENEPENTLSPEETVLKGIFWQNNTAVSLAFSHAFEPDGLPSILTSAPASLSFDPLEPTHISLTFSSPISTTPIQVLVESSPTSCFGAVQADTFLLSNPVPATFGDVVLNELLFNPKSGGVDFIELWNTSDKTIDLDALRIASLNEDGTVNDVFACGADKQLFPPKSYLVLSTNSALVCATYNCGKGRFFVHTDMPSMPDDAGAIALIQADQSIIEQVSYEDGWHHPSINNAEGVSLERISPNLPSSDQHSWHSASSRANFATPGKLNSQFNSGTSSNAHFTLSAETVSPNNDGFNDVLTITYNLPEGSQLTTRVFALNGVMISTLVENKLMQPSGSFTWNGRTDNLEIAPTGIYVLLFEWFTAGGDTGNAKLTVALSQ
jgi:hypothetical protein